MAKKQKHFGRPVSEQVEDVVFFTQLITLQEATFNLAYEHLIANPPIHRESLLEEITGEQVCYAIRDATDVAMVKAREYVWKDHQKARAEEKLPAMRELVIAKLCHWLASSLLAEYIPPEGKPEDESGMSAVAEKAARALGEKLQLSDIGIENVKHGFHYDLSGGHPTLY